MFNRPKNLWIGFKITKKQLCEARLKEWTKESGLTPKPGYVTQSSSLAISMQYLGLLNNDQEMKDYAETRGGCLTNQVLNLLQDKLSFRELLELLPE